MGNRLIDGGWNLRILRVRDNIRIGGVSTIGDPGKILGFSWQITTRKTPSPGCCARLECLQRIPHRALRRVPTNQLDRCRGAFSLPRENSNGSIFSRFARLKRQPNRCGELRFLAKVWWKKNPTIQHRVPVSNCEIAPCNRATNCSRGAREHITQGPNFRLRLEHMIILARSTHPVDQIAMHSHAIRSRW